jgi:hypothetical protein
MYLEKNVMLSENFKLKRLINELIKKLKTEKNHSRWCLKKNKEQKFKGISLKLYRTTEQPV